MDLNVISFNIRCRDDAAGHSVAERAPRLWGAVSAYRPDILGLQEYTPLWESEIDRYFSAEYDLFYRYRTHTGWIETAPILWRRDRFACRFCGVFWLSDTPEVESRGWDRLDHNRICTYAILEERAGGGAFCFMNTHLGFGDECQQKSVHLIAEYQKKLGDLPTVLTGDFNMTPAAPAYREITALMTDVNAATARDNRPTYHGYAPEAHSDLHGEDHKNLLIDYCFVTAGAQPLAYRRIDTLFGGKYPSDHFGVFAVVRI